jgi:hypothetical protein
MQNIKSFLDRTISRKEIDFLVQELLAEPQGIDELLALLNDDDTRTGWHAAWALQKFFEKYPEFLSGRIEATLTAKAIATGNESVRRLTFGVIARADLPDELPVNLVNCCFEWLLSAQTSIAVKAGCMHYLHRVCKREPELLPELRMCVKQLLETTEAGAVRSVAKKILKD